ncbi:hypothetical protein ACSVHK_10915 [Acinetobacter nosocomialis]|uniref:Uncharacterized protein n=1 Tax=Acinetobacter nosocomialis TaxID=106654 RepID=A0AB36LYM3_ACINO|nr:MULTISPECIES: hypothetical protein [Acinetobacter]KCZ31856.1 hypothetical protein J812_2173 [Acinetobacter baumannii 25977_9]EXB67406.1 hypothetical protein J525_2915 [Acinetobacter sp. 21871]EXR63722.1 hypothetical protein J678_1684 [Acinetobacter sp. 1424608]EXT40321.1 hypothetical protein J811_0697 [Acinetobacter sp. 25977_8]EXT45261.1 hypothetical protein J810_1406 [Acinetobacter sp. 25977_7]
MFITSQLNIIHKIIKNQSISTSVVDQLEQSYVNLEATLLRAKVLRDFSKTQIVYLIQSHIEPQQSSLAYLFSPFIFANLNKAAIYTTPATPPVLTILNKYYQADKKVVFKIDEVLESLKIYLDLELIEMGEADFIYLKLIKALCRSDISTVFLITHLELDLDALKELEQFLKIKIYWVKDVKDEGLKSVDQLDMRKLLFKNKDEAYVQLCAHFAQINAALVGLCDTFTTSQMTHLIDDMFYSEHIFEKLSVYSEYMQTLLQSQHSLTKKEIA